MSDIGRLRDRLYSATASLINARAIRKRVHDAYISGLLGLLVDDFPKDLQPAFQSIEDSLTFAEAVGDEGKIIASLGSMNDEQVEKVANDIFELFVELSKRDTGD